MCLKPIKFGFALGLWWGVGMLLASWGAWLFNWGNIWVHVMSSFYIGMAPSLIGGIIGLVWGFIDFFIFGLLIAWTYNCCSGDKK
jgi:hypothetical protein